MTSSPSSPRARAWSMARCTLFFFFNDTAPTEIYTTYDTLSLHDALPICLDRHRPLGVGEHLPRLEAGRVPHRDVILLPGARRNGIDRGRMAEHLVLGDQRSGHVLRDHEAAVEAAVGREEGRQTVGE